MTDIVNDCRGKTSTTRVIALAWGLGVLTLYIYLSFLAGAFVAIPKEVIYLTLGMSGAKVVQSWKELSTADPLKSTQPTKP